MTILSGCKTTPAKIVKIEDFCLRYDSMTPTKADYINLIEIRQNAKYTATIDKYINYHAINEKEFKLCLAK